MIVEKPKPNVFCETTIAWRHEDGTESPITDAYVGPNFGWALHRDAARLTLLVRRWKSRSGYPDTDA